MEPSLLTSHPPITMASLLDQARDAANPDVVRTVSSLIGATPSTTGAGFATAIPTLLAGIVTTASTPAGAHWVRAIISEGGYGDGTLDKLLGMLTGGRPTERLMSSGRQLLTSLFGGKQQDVMETIARSANLSGPAAGNLMCVAAPMVMGVLGREVATHGLDWSGVMNYLAGQRASIASVTPPTLASVLGLPAPTVPAAASEAERHYRDGLAVATSGRGQLGAWLFTVVAALSGFAIVFAMHPPRAGDVGKQVASALPRQLQALTLPNGERLDVRIGSFLAKLNAYLASATDTSVPRRFVFDDVTFEPGSADLTPGSRPSVDGLGRTMKAYPTVRVSLEGFTDSTGDPVANKDLSFDRAHAIKERLVERGVAADRIQTAGFGSDQPVAANDTEEGRAQNRRTEVVVIRR
jgi:outer membrane protein OmpA-like peptidoglycan-associated protein